MGRTANEARPMLRAVRRFLLGLPLAFPPVLLAAAAREANASIAFAPSAAGIWAPITSAPVPSPRLASTTLRNGSELLIWAGARAKDKYDTTYYHDGARYNPATDTWAPLPIGARYALATDT